MLIDWFTVIAQAVNFLILVWLMKRFLYGPILRVIDEREKKIAAELADADAKRAEAKQQRDDFAQKNAALDQQREDLKSKATSEAKTLKERLVKEARLAADEISTKRHESLKTDARNLSQALIRRTQQEVFAIARKTLADLAGASLEERASGVFIQRLKDMDSPTKAELAEAVTSVAEPAVIRSAFPLPDEQRKAIQQVINEIFAAGVHIRFETAPEIISGVELTAGGKKIAWSIASYLTSLEIGVSELLRIDEQVNADSKPQPKATQPVASPV